MSHADAWYVVKQETGECVIISAEQLPSSAPDGATHEEKWGPYSSSNEAISRRVGLIRAGKCKPV
jgi:hypothetical protein